MSGKKVFRSFGELREHFFPERAKKEKARAEVETIMKKEVQRGWAQAVMPNKEQVEQAAEEIARKYISPDYDPSRPVGGTNHPCRCGPNEPHPFRKD